MAMKSWCLNPVVLVVTVWCEIIITVAWLSSDELGMPFNSFASSNVGQRVNDQWRLLLKSSVAWNSEPFLWKSLWKGMLRQTCSLWKIVMLFLCLSQHDCTVMSKTLSETRLYPKQIWAPCWTNSIGFLLDINSSSISPLKLSISRLLCLRLRLESRGKRPKSKKM